MPTPSEVKLGNATTEIAQEPNGPFDVLLRFMTSPLGILIIILIIAAVIIFLIFRHMNKKKEFEFVSFARIIDEDFKSKFELKGLDVNGSLTQGFEFLGKINRIIHEHANIDVLYYNPKEEKFVTPKNKPLRREYDIYIFRLNQRGFILIRIIRNLLGQPKRPYVIVDTRHLENFGGPRSQMWNIKTQVAIQRFGDVFITSDMGKDYLSDLATKYAHESELTYLANYPHKAVYLEMEHAKWANRAKTKKEIETKAYKDYKRGTEDVRDDAEDKE